MTNLNQTYVCPACGERLRVGHRSIVLAAATVILLGSLLLVLEETKHIALVIGSAIPLTFLVAWLTADVKRHRPKA